MALASSSRPFRILFAEDDPADIDITVRLFEQAEHRTALKVVENGAEALAYLRREGAHEGAPRPDLILLDLNLPLVSGTEVLEAIKRDPELRRIPVVVLTSSDEISDIQSVYNLRANCYLTKPSSLHQFKEMVSIIDKFWFSVAQLPNER